MSGSLLTLGYVHHAAPNARRLAMQQGLIRLWCRRNHRRLSKIYFDLGRNRAARDEMRARLSDHANALLVVPALHHLTRDGWALLDLLEAFFAEGGPALVAIQDSFDSRTQTGRLLYQVQRAAQDVVFVPHRRDGETVH